MSFWTDKNYEPKFTDRFVANFNFDQINSVNWYEVTSVEVPNFKVGIKNYTLLNREIKFPENIKWNPIKISFVETKDNLLIDLLKTHYRSTDSRNPYLLGNHNYELDSTISKDSSFENSVIIKQISADGEQLEKWEINNCHIVDFKISALNYANSGLRTIDLTIEYEWAFLTIGDQSTNQPQIIA